MAKLSLPTTGSFALPPRNDTFFSVFTKHQLRPNPKPAGLSSISVSGHTAVVTGGNAGLGLESSSILLSRGLSHLIIGSRSLSRGEDAVRPLRKSYPDAKIDVWELDMNNYESVKGFAQKCDKLERLNHVILGAGIMNTEFVMSPAGVEEMIQVNYLSTAFLGLLLLPILKMKNKSESHAHLTLVASGAALIAEFENKNKTHLIKCFNNGNEWASGSAKKRYDDSKGMVLMLTDRLQTLAAENTIVNVVDPSFTPGTGFFRGIPLPVRVLLWPLTKLLGTSVNNAGWRYVDAAVARGAETKGSFISDWEISPHNSFMYTEEGGRYMDRLWEATLEDFECQESREALAALTS